MERVSQSSLVISPNLKVVLVLSENVNKVKIVYASCEKRLQMPFLIACDY